MERCLTTAVREHYPHRVEAHHTFLNAMPGSDDSDGTSVAIGEAKCFALLELLAIMLLSSGANLFSI